MRTMASMLRGAILCCLFLAAVLWWQGQGQGQVPAEVLELRTAQRLERMHQVHQVFLMVLWAGGFAVCLSAFGLAGWLLAKARNERTYIHAEDGLFPVVRKQSGTLGDRLRGRSVETVYNPNLWALPAGRLTVDRDGSMQLASALDGYTHDQMLRAHAGQQRIQRAGAAGHERAPSKWQVLHEAGMLEQALPQRRQTQPEMLPPPPAQRLVLHEALNQSRRDAIVVGQADDGRLCKLDLQRSVHAGVIGATGTGKTESTGFQVALVALKAGYQVVILDPKGGMDWRPFAHAAEWHETDPALFADHVALLHAEFRRRYAIARQHGVNHVAELRSKELPPLLAIIEEYDDMRRSLRNMGRLGQLDNQMDELMRLARAADVHLLLVDQYPEEWSNQVLGNTKARLVYQLGPGQGNKVGEWAAQTLPDCGRFICRDQQYSAWHVKPALPHLLPRLPANRFPRLIEGTAVEVGREKTTHSFVGVGVPPTSGTNARMNERTNAEPSSKWDDITAQWVEENPKGRQADLARYMAALDGRPNEYENYRSTAHQQWHRYHPNGKDYQP